MTPDEKRQLSQNINNLPPSNLGELVQIIHQRMPSLADNSHPGKTIQPGIPSNHFPEEIEIDLELLDAATLRHLEKYVKNCLSKRKKKSPESKSAMETS
jgi:hypothetical protein